MAIKIKNKQTINLRAEKYFICQSVVILFPFPLMTHSLNKHLSEHRNAARLFISNIFIFLSEFLVTFPPVSRRQAHSLEEKSILDICF